MDNERDVLTPSSIKTAIEPILHTVPVERAYLFGSCARGEQTDASDVDLYLQFDQDDIDTFSLIDLEVLRSKLEEALGSDVDIVSGSERYLSRRRPRLLANIKQDWMLVYG